MILKYIVSGDWRLYQDTVLTVESMTRAWKGRNRTGDWLRVVGYVVVGYVIVSDLFFTHISAHSCRMQNYDFPNNCEDYIHRIGRTGVCEDTLAFDEHH